MKAEFSFITGNYRILVLSWIFMDFASEIPGTYYPLYVLALGGSPAILGVIAFASSLALAAVQFPGGYLADKFGRRWLVSTMTFAVALGSLFYALAPSWHFILLGGVLVNLFLLYQPALLAMIADSLPPEKRGMGYSIITLIAHAATTPGPIVAGLLFISFGLVDSVRIGYFIVVAFYLIAAILRLNLRETVTQAQKITAKDVLAAYPTSLRDGVTVWRKVSSSMRYLFVANLFATFGQAMIMPFIAIYAIQDLRVKEVEWSILLSLMFVAMIAFAFPCGKLIDKYGRKRPLLASFFIIVPAGLLFIYGDFPRLSVALPLIGMSGIMAGVAFGSLQADLVPKEERGKIIGSSNFVNNILMATGALFGGIIYETVSHQLPFFLLLTLTIPQVLVTVFLVHEPMTRHQ